MNKLFTKKIKISFSYLQKRAEEKRFIEKIENGLKNNEFKMHLQFIVDNKTKKLSSVEALSRWETSDGKVLMPGAYIGVMERSGLIAKFDYYMFDKVCAKLAQWNDSEFSHLTASCNFTRITISDKDFVTKIKDISEKYTFEHSKLLIEITEDSIEKNLDVAMQNIRKIKELGFRVALDDLGSGNTALVSLCEYPIDVVKLDREVLLLTKVEKGQKLFHGIIALVHKLGLAAVCEGVETDEQNDIVSASECDYIQGWFYSKAMPEEKAEEFARGYGNC